MKKYNAKKGIKSKRSSSTKKTKVVAKSPQDIQVSLSDFYARENTDREFTISCSRSTMTTTMRTRTEAMPTESMSTERETRARAVQMLMSLIRMMKVLQPRARRLPIKEVKKSQSSRLIKGFREEKPGFTFCILLVDT